MRDNLDLKQLAKQSSKERTRSKRNSVILVIVLILTAVVFLSDSSSPATTYVNTRNGWQGIKGYQGNAVTIQSAPDGTTWLLTSNPVSLNRWTGSDWEQNGYNGFRGVTCVCGMAVDQDNVWIATDKGAFRLHDEDWTYYDEAIKGRPAAIVTSPFGVYIIDNDRNLSHFDGQTWEIRDLRDILPGVSTNQVENHPQLFAADDGSILLRWLGVWHFNGQAWQEVTIEDTSLTRVQLVGTARNRLWTNWADGLIESDLNGADWVSYEADDVGIPTNAQIYQVSESADGYQFATNIGLINFDGERGQRVSFGNSEIGIIHAVESNSIGDTWIITQFDRTNAIILQLLIAICPTVFILILLVFVFSNSRSAMRQLKDVRERIQELLPDLPTYKKQQTPTLLMILLGAGTGLTIVFGAFGAAREIIIPIVVLIIYLVLAEVKKIQTRNTDNSIHSKQRVSTSFIQSMTLLLLLAVGMNMVDWINPTYNIPFFAVWCFFTIAVSIVMSIRLMYTYQNENMYEKLQAEQTPEAAIQGDDLNRKYQYAYAAIVSGRVEEAEILSKAVIAQAQHTNITLLSHGLNILGISLINQHRETEALPIVELAAKLNPTSVHVLTTLGDFYFHRDSDPERVLELTAFNNQYSQTRWFNRLTKQDGKPANAALQAWALVKLGRLKEGDALIQNAMSRLAPKYKTVVGYVYYIQGRIEEAKGNQAQAAEWFSKASQSDSGLYGQLASKALIALTGGAAPVSASD